MIPIRRGDRGPAVEDVQRRLRSLGYDLGRGGIDGIYLGATAQAVKAFQEHGGLDEDGWVGEQTWAALVDATFTLGDRMLYLRLPHFHGRDVRVLQEALNVLGFACGQIDGIFGAFAERAVRDFQRNAGLPADGIVGAETVKALSALRHVWQGKDPRAHSAAQLAPARAAEVLASVEVVLGGMSEAGRRIAARAVNLASATSDRSRLRLLEEPAEIEGGVLGTAALVVHVSTGTTPAVSGRPVVTARGERLASRLLTAVAASGERCPNVVIEFADEISGDEREEQRAAVELLDAVCVVFQ